MLQVRTWRAFACIFFLVVQTLAVTFAATAQDNPEPPLIVTPAQLELLKKKLPKTPAPLTLYH